MRTKHQNIQNNRKFYKQNSDFNNTNSLRKDGCFCIAYESCSSSWWCCRCACCALRPLALFPFTHSSVPAVSVCPFSKHVHSHNHTQSHTYTQSATICTLPSLSRHDYHLIIIVSRRVDEHAMQRRTQREHSTYQRVTQSSPSRNFIRKGPPPWRVGRQDATGNHKMTQFEVLLR